MSELERRYIRRECAPITIEKRDDKELIVGYAAVFYKEGDPGTEYELWSDVREHIMPGAFDRALKENCDTRGLFNHDPNQLLARVGAKTLRLSVDSIGLRYEIEPGETTCAKDVVAHLRRGDLYGSSFSFYVQAQTWKTVGDLDIREVNEAFPLFDVGPVTFPAYEGTSAGVRSHDPAEARKAHGEWKHGVSAKLAAYRARAVEVSEAS